MDDETKAVAGWVLDQILVMLHPFMPFITEELWTGLGDRAAYPLITAKWPEPMAKRDAGASADIDWLIRLVGELRGAKDELGLPSGARLTAHFPAGLKGRNGKQIGRAQVRTPVNNAPLVCRTILEKQQN